MKEQDDLMEHRIDALSEYLDDTLPAEERRAIEAHLATCASCASTLEELRLVVARARALEPQEPDLDLWPAIAARLEPRGASIAGRIGAWFASRRFSFSFPQLAGATAAIALVAAGVTWFASQRSAGPVAVLEPSAPAERGTVATPPGTTSTARPWHLPRSPEPRAGRGPASSFASFDEARYDAAVAELQRVLHEHRDELDTTTVRILEQNLAIIDRATEEARRALEADPANPYLNGHLAEQMRLKVRLLQRAAEVVTAHS